MPRRRNHFHFYLPAFVEPRNLHHRFRRSRFLHTIAGRTGRRKKFGTLKLVD